MIFRKACTRDRTNLINLWGNVFGDDEEVTGRLLDYFAGPGNVYIAEEKGQITGQLLSVPCTSGGMKGAYLYALATDPAYRGLGIMSDLMDHVHLELWKSGIFFSVLIPASLSLFVYYKKHGFKDILMLNMEIVSEKRDTKKFSMGEIPAELFLKLRKKYLGDYVITFDAQRTELILEEQWYYGSRAVFSDNGYVFFVKADDILFITEIAAENALAQEMIAAAKYHTDTSTVKVTLPINGNQHFENVHNIEKTPQAQYKWLGEGNAPEFYIRFALDDLAARIHKNKRDAFV